VVAAYPWTGSTIYGQGGFTNGTTIHEPINRTGENKICKLKNSFASTYLYFFYKPICFASLPYILFISLLASLRFYISLFFCQFALLCCQYLIYKSTGYATLLYILQVHLFHLLCCHIFLLPVSLLQFASIYLLYFFKSICLSCFTSQLASLCYFTDFICDYFTQLTLPVIKLLALNSPLGGMDLICITYFYLTHSWVHEW